MALALKGLHRNPEARVSDAQAGGVWMCLECQADAGRCSGDIQVRAILSITTAGIRASIDRVPRPVDRFVRSWVCRGRTGV
jgi:heterodisulfide reductase subunit C